VTLRRLCPTLLVVGLALMLPFEYTVTRLLGVACLVGFVVCGVFLIASPELLARDDEDAP
jgi:hypothetical protein